MTRPIRDTIRLAVSLLVAAATFAPDAARAAAYRIVGWNNLGMHCMDDDFSVFSLLPPFNTFHAQVVDPQGHKVTDPAALGITVTYQAVADPDGSINSTAAGKTNFWDHVFPLFGAVLPVDGGLAGDDMPGAANVPQAMTWDPAAGWFVATGVPITPYDDAGHKNPYPLMRLVARNAQGAALATTDIVLPVSDEMDCKSCHASGSGPAALPSEGWAFDLDAQRDVRINIVRLHDDRQRFDPVYQAALAAVGFDTAGLYATAVTGGRAVLCASCHASEALPGSGQPGIGALTQAIHGRHADVEDPTTNQTLGAATNRGACYRCHPGSETRCLRGAMGAAVAPGGTLAMQCQSCHGSMTDVAAPTRTGWLDEPTCQNCHSGTAVTNAGQIRFQSVFDAPGHRRLAADQTFATNADTPAPGLSLYRFSSGHGGLACEACHGSTHAEFPALHRNDNLQSIALQGHAGTLVECSSCHPVTPSTTSGGPHGMHPVGQTWVNQHPDRVENGGAATCRSCHGTDYRGTVLSRAHADRTLTSEFGTMTVWRGFQIGCYGCHRGPEGEDRNPNRAAVVTSASVAGNAGTPTPVTLAAADLDGDPLTLRIVSQPTHGTAGLVGTVATYFPDAGWTGTDMFTFAAWDGSIDSNLGTVTISTGGGGCAGRDLDGDGISDTCDPVDATLMVARANLRAKNGAVRTSARGTFQTAPPTDAFDAASGITVTVRDGGAIALAHAWPAIGCPANAHGVIRCSSPDRLAKAIFQPIRRSPGLWRWKALLRGGAAAGTPAEPITVAITHSAAVDRVGQAVTCRASATSLTCR